jgi:anti-sigma factor RsiW
VKCPAAAELIEAYVDGELDATQKSEVRGHLEGCISCAETHWRLMEMRTNLKKEGPYYEAPAPLRDRVVTSLRNEARRDNPRRSAPWNWMAIAASVLLAVSAIWNVQMLRSRQAAPDRIASEILSSHVRSLMGNHLLDVPSTDQHTVKPWFNGKVDFSPAVKDLAGQGYPLIGGRIEYVDEKPVAVLVYQHAKHVINVFTWPETIASRREELKLRGYNLIEWTDAGMTNWAVSDLNIVDLREFVRQL